MLLNDLALASVPKKGGRLRMGITEGGSTDTLDPAGGGTFMAMAIVIDMHLRNTLVEVDSKSKAIPELAESWESTPDAKKWIFKLRKGVEFHNGKTMDAEDVMFSINHHRGQESKSAAKPIVDQIVDLKADGKYSVVFALAGGNADFPYLMSDYHLLIVPNGTTNFNLGIGTGPYVLQNFEPGVSSFSKRNPNYWKEGRAHFDEVEIIGIADVNARVNALKSKKIDVMDRPDRKTVNLLEKDPNIQVIETHGYKHATIPMHTQMAPYDNNDVRLALKHAIDRKQMLKMVLRGHGKLGNDHPIASAMRYYASELPQRKYDPEKAQYYIKKAGLKDHTFKLHTSDAAFAGAVDMAMLYKEQAAKCGIKIEVVKEPDDGYYSDVWLKKGWCFDYWWGRATEDWMFSTTYADGAAWNETHWKNERFNKLLIEARSELDEAKRREMYVEMQKLVRDEGGAIIPVYMSDLHAASTKLKFDMVGANYAWDGLRLPERWWFA
jgi:peptide/nickel transport system substrate-binding protein